MNQLRQPVFDEKDHLHVVSLLGYKMRGSSLKAQDYVFDQALGKFMAINMVIYFLVRNQDHFYPVQNQLSASLQISIYFMMGFIYMVWVTFITTINITLVKLGWLKSVYIAAMNMPNILIMQVSAYVLLGVASGEKPEKIFHFDLMVQDFFMYLLFELIFVIYVVPQSLYLSVINTGYQTVGRSSFSEDPDRLGAGNAPYEIDLKKSDQGEEIHPPKTEDPLTQDEDEFIPEPIEAPDVGKTIITTSVRNFELNDLIYVKVQGHYLHYFTVEGEVKTRGRIHRIQEQFGPEVGVQVNRSTWVKLDSVQGIQEKSGKLHIQLEGGSEEVVTASRRLAVEMALKQKELI